MRIAGAAALLITAVAAGQTRIDLRKQGRNVDFSQAESTKPFKAGSALPASCGIGETFFRTDAPRGSNFYACTATDTWTLQGGAAVERTEAFEWVPLSDQEARITAGSFRFGRISTQVNESVLTISGRPSGTVWIYAVATGSVVVGHNLGAGNLAASGNGYIVDAATADFPIGSVPLYECPVQAGNWGACLDKRTPYAADPIAAGPYGALNVDCSRGNGCVIDAVPSVVPTKAGANDFTGLNTFTRLQIPRGSIVLPGDCDEESESGRLFVNTGAPSGQQLLVCEGSAGWKTISGGGGGATLQLTAGASGALQIDCADAEHCTIEIVPSVVATTAGANVFTGANRFSSLQAPQGTALPAAECDESGEAGKLFIKTDAPSGQQLYVCEGTTGWKTASPPGTGTVTSVGLTAPPEFSVTGSPVTSAGTLSLTKTVQEANRVYAGPASGAAAAPSFRELASGDYPNYSGDRGYFLSLPLNTSAGGQAVSGANNEVRVFGAFIDRKLTVSRVGFYCSTGWAGAVVRFGVYDTSGNLVVQSGAIDTSAAGNKASSFTAATINPGFYYLAWAASDSRVQVSGQSLGTAVAAALLASAQPLTGTAEHAMDASGLPATLGTITRNTGIAIPVFLLGQ